MNDLSKLIERLRGLQVTKLTTSIKSIEDYEEIVVLEKFEYKTRRKSLKDQYKDVGTIIVPKTAGNFLLVLVNQEPDAGKDNIMLGETEIPLGDNENYTACFSDKNWLVIATNKKNLHIFNSNMVQVDTIQLDGVIYEFFPIDNGKAAIAFTGNSRFLAVNLTGNAAQPVTLDIGYTPSILTQEIINIIDVTDMLPSETTQTEDDRKVIVVNQSNKMVIGTFSRSGTRFKTTGITTLALPEPHS